MTPKASIKNVFILSLVTGEYLIYRSTGFQSHKAIMLTIKIISDIPSSL